MNMLKRMALFILIFFAFMPLANPAKAVTEAKISNIKTLISNQYAIIQFETDVPVKADIVYSTSSAFTNFNRHNAVLTEPNLTTKHQLILDSYYAQGGKRIYYRFEEYHSNNMLSNDIYSLDFLPDSQKIEISSVEIYDVRSNSARVKWHTNQPTTGVVYANHNTGASLDNLLDYRYELSFQDSNLSTDHDVLISGLVPKTTGYQIYYIGIQALSGTNFAYTFAGNFGTYSTQWHNMRNITTDTTVNTATIQWTHDLGLEDDKPAIEYGKTSAYGETITASNCGGMEDANCLVTIPNLSPGATYHYRIKMDSEYSADKTFTTKAGASQTANTSCASWTYSNWSVCANGRQERTILTFSPTGCSGGSPLLSQVCSSSVNNAADTNTISYSKKVNSNFIKVNGSSAVYWLSADNKRYLFSNRSVFSSWFVNDFTGLRMISQDEFNNIPSGENLTVKPGNYLKFDNSDLTYYVQDNNNICKTSSRPSSFFLIQSGFEADYNVTGNCI